LLKRVRSTLHGLLRRGRLDQIGSHWDDRSERRAHDALQNWLDSPIVLEEYVQPLISGLPKVHWLTGAVERLRIPPGGRWLSIGCGGASAEIEAARSGFFSEMTAFDVSSGSLEKAREAARRARVSNIEFSVADLDNLRLPREHYDVILAIMSLHHVERLDPLLEQIEGALKPTGLFLTNEYVGPRRLQFTDRQLSIARELLEAMPECWRRDIETGSVKTEASRLSIREWRSIDPSEAVRSDEILPEISKRFRIVERHDYGGAILHPMLEGIVHNFDPNEQKDVGAIRLLATFESILMRLGAISSDFTLIVARKHGDQRSRKNGLDGRPSEKEIDDRRPFALPSARSYVDFRRAAHTSEVVSGFHPWDVDSRWLGESGELRLRVAAPRLNLLLAAHPNSAVSDREPMTIRISLRPDADRDEVELGHIVLKRPGVQEHVFPLGEALVSRVLNEEVRVILRADRTWVPAEAIAGSQDQRRLSVQTLRVAFEP
jgi:ubiquinone/menaquinone biosynthesis C-methylase UbiE